MTAPIGAIQADAEKVVINYLRSRTEITDICGDRVWTDLPATKTYPILQVRRRGGAPVDAIAWLDAPILQLDAYGGPRATADLLIRTAIAVLAVAEQGPHTEAVITGITPGLKRYLPEADLNDGKSRPRYSQDVTVFLHPLPT